MGRHYRKTKHTKKTVAIAAIIFFAAIALLFFAKQPSDNLYIKNITDKVMSVVSAEMIWQDKAVASYDNKSQDVKKQGTEKNTAKKKDNKLSKDMSGDKDKMPEIAIIVDDGGANLEFAKRVSKLKIPLTWAILPYERHTKDYSAIALENGIPFLLHLPMQAVTDKQGSNKYLIGEGMTSSDVKKVTQAAIETLPYCIGINNHRGSLTTTDKKTTTPFLQNMKDRNLLFVDSATSAKTIAYSLARNLDVKALKNDIFLDNKSDEKAIEDMLNIAVKMAKRRGRIIAICHFRPTTVSFLEHLDARYEKIPVNFINIPQMAEDVYE